MKFRNFYRPFCFLFYFFCLSFFFNNQTRFYSVCSLSARNGGGKQRQGFSVQHIRHVKNRNHAISTKFWDTLGKPLGSVLDGGWSNNSGRIPNDAAEGGFSWQGLSSVSKIMVQSENLDLCLKQKFYRNLKTCCMVLNFFSFKAPLGFEKLGKHTSLNSASHPFSHESHTRNQMRS